MKHLIIASHGSLATSLIDTAKLICGESINFDAIGFCMTEGKSTEEFAEEVQKYVDNDPKGDYFVLADLYGASPCNTCVQVLGYYNYRLVTGVNLGMLLEIITAFDNCSIEELEEKALDAGKGGVQTFYLHV
jgi:mannose/fructose-specific phosphotransferase system component IIA